jgi:hypothetical protein
MLKRASTTFVAVLRALLANKYVEIASMAGHCRADVSSAKSETRNPVLSDYDWQLVRTGVAVEKLICGKRAQIASRQDAIEMIFSGRLGIFYPPKSRRSGGYRLFQHPQANSPIE